MLLGLIAYPFVGRGSVVPSRPAELGPPILRDVSRSRALTGHRAAGPL